MLQEITQKRLDEINVALQLQLTLAAVNYLAFADWPLPASSIFVGKDGSVAKIVLQDGALIELHLCEGWPEPHLPTRWELTEKGLQKRRELRELLRPDDARADGGSAI